MTVGINNYLCDCLKITYYNINTILFDCQQLTKTLSGEWLDERFTEQRLANGTN